MRMKQFLLRTLLLMGAFVWMNAALAATPVWSFASVAGYPSTVTVNTTGTAVIQYQVTNQSSQPHTLRMKPIRGITPSGCAAPLGSHQSCTLSLSVNGSVLQGNVTGGPVLCEQGNPLLCYQPAQADSLAIHLTQQLLVVSPSAGDNGSIDPDTVQSVNSGVNLSFTATPADGYGVNQWFLDGVLSQTGGTQYELSNITANHVLQVTFGQVTLTPSVSSLDLSVHCDTSPAPDCAQINPNLTGVPRQIVMTNTGSAAATHVNTELTAFPAGTSITSNTCSGTLNAGDSCRITITPGPVATSDCTLGTAPQPTLVTVSADGGLSTPVNVFVLGYGCQYQGGFVYSIDDTTAATMSIRGKVASLVDQAEPWLVSVPSINGMIWSSNGNGKTSADYDFTVILGIDELSTELVPSPTEPAYPVGTPPYLYCDGRSDGACDSSNIISYYNANRVSGGSPPTPLTDYAAGLCTFEINGYTDWYLPSICEMDSVHDNLVCPAGTQSFVSSLAFLLSDPASLTPSESCSPPTGTQCLAGYYWSSTEYHYIPDTDAWAEYFTSVSSGSEQVANENKADPVGVRCSRVFNGA